VPFRLFYCPPHSHIITQYVLRPLSVSLPLLKSDVTSEQSLPSSLTFNRNPPLVTPYNSTFCIQHRHNVRGVGLRRLGGCRGRGECPFDVFRTKNSFFCYSVQDGQKKKKGKTVVPPYPRFQEDRQCGFYAYSLIISMFYIPYWTIIG
jgi:hypothetical protein